MNRRQILLGGCGSIVTTAIRAPRPISSSPNVVFLNPGESAQRANGQQWQLMTRFMTAAAKALQMRLEVVYAERDHLLMLRQAEALAHRASAPDYVVIANEKLMAPEMLRLLSRSTARIMLVHNDMTAAQRNEIGHERGAFRNWIGTVTSDARSAAFRLMKYLYRTMEGVSPRVVGITGDPSTPVSLERARGVQDWLTSVPHARLNQLAFGNWRFDDAYDKARILLKRYPDTNMIWAGNDAMTLGAQRACDEQGANVIVGGMGALPEALVDIMRGRLTAMMAGDYFVGAFAMVLIHDHHAGMDFAVNGDARRKFDFLTLVHRGNASFYYERLFDGAGDPDFSIFSRRRGTGCADYDFSIDRLLHHVKKFS